MDLLGEGAWLQGGNKIMAQKWLRQTQNRIGDHNIGSEEGFGLLSVS